MKPEQKKIIDKLIELCKYSEESCNEIVMNELRKVLFLDTSKSAGKFNIYNYIETNKNMKNIRPTFFGVKHEEDMQIATDARILCAIHTGNDESLNGKIIDAEGNEIKGNYPKWRSVIPTDIQEIELNSADIVQFLQTAKVNQREKIDTFLEIESVGKDFCYSAKYIKLFYQFLENYSDSKVYFRKGDFPLLYANAGNNHCILMPVERKAESSLVSMYNIS